MREKRLGSRSFRRGRATLAVNAVLVQGEYGKMGRLKHGDSVWGANGFGEWALVVFPALFDTQLLNGLQGLL